jgi:MFS family permease
MEECNSGRRRWWASPDVWHLLLVALFAELGFAVLNISVMPVFLRTDRGLSEGVIGLVFACFLVSEAVFKPFAGHWADRYGRRRYLIIGSALVTMTPVLTVLVPRELGSWQTPVYMALRVIDGMAAALLWPSVYAAMNEAVAPLHRGKALSLLNTCFMLGLAFSLPVGGLLNDLFRSRLPSFVLASSLFGLTLIASLRFKPLSDGRDEFSGDVDFPWRDFVPWMKRIPGVLFIAFVTFLGVGFPLAVMKLFAEDVYQMSESRFGALVLPAALAMAVASAPMGAFGSRIGKERAVRLGLLLCTVGMWVFALGYWFEVLRSQGMAMVAVLLVGLGFLVALPAWYATVCAVNSRRSGSLLAMVMTAQGLGAILGTVVGAKLYEFSPYAPVLACATCVSLGMMLSWVVLPSSPGLKEGGEGELTVEESGRQSPNGKS